MNVFYSPQYNFRLGPLAYLHPFDGTKFEKVFKELQNYPGLVWEAPPAPIDQQSIDNFVGALTKRMLKNKVHIFRALEVPSIPLIPFSTVDHRILQPMRWGVGGTLAASRKALKGENCWNLAGGYHHASRSSMEGFCIYNDIGITVQELIKSGELTESDPFLIIDVDAHHGNGNAYTFLHDEHVTLLDVYNKDIYPLNPVSRERVNISVPLPSNTVGSDYLDQLERALLKLKEGPKIAFVVAGTDVLATDPLGGLGLTIEDVAKREQLIYRRLKDLSIPMVFLGGGGYGKESAKAIIESLKSFQN